MNVWDEMTWSEALCWSRIINFLFDREIVASPLYPQVTLLLTESAASRTSLKHKLSETQIRNTFFLPRLGRHHWGARPSLRRGGQKTWKIQKKKKKRINYAYSHSHTHLLIHSLVLKKRWHWINSFGLLTSKFLFHSSTPDKTPMH